MSTSVTFKQSRALNCRHCRRHRFFFMG